MHPVRRSLIELNTSVLMLGLVPLFAKWIRLDAVSIIGWRALLGAVALVGFLLLRRTRLRLNRRRDYGIVVLLGVLMAVHWASYFQAIQVSTVAVAVVAMFTWPVIAVLIEPLISGGRYHPRDLLLAVLALCGVALVVPEFSLGSSAVHGAAWGLFSAVLFALRNVLHRRLLTGYPSSLMMGYQLVVIAACLMPLSRQPPADDWVLLGVLAVVFTALAHSLLVGSMRQLKAKTVGMISCLQPVYGIVAAALLLGEYTSPRGILGAALVVAVAVVETVVARGEAARAARESKASWRAQKD
ncbi:MAG: DMT family transporter [Ectothiorhodospiraceae bacterium]|jgi:drug/metabolite transporter (DMT)-like permease